MSSKNGTKKYGRNIKKYGKSACESKRPVKPGSNQRQRDFSPVAGIVIDMPHEDYRDVLRGLEIAMQSRISDRVENDRRAIAAQIAAADRSVTLDAYGNPNRFGKKAERKALKRAMREVGIA